MSRICCKNNFSHPEARCTPLLQFIRIQVDDLVLIRLRVPGQDLLPAPRLTGNVFLLGEARDITIRYTVKSVMGDARRHVPVCRVDDKVAIPVVVALEVVVHLVIISSVLVLQMKSRGSYIRRDNLCIQRLTGVFGTE